MTTDFITVQPPCKLADVAIVSHRHVEQINDHEPDQLLLEFRRAVEIEFRLLYLEHWLASTKHPRRWTVCVLRMLTLIIRRPALRPFQDSCHGYLRAVFEAQQ